jgi:hypothetical protein
MTRGVTAMATKSTTKKVKVPDEATEHLAKELKGLGVEELGVSQTGKYFYVTHGGSPLCRLGYRGEVKEWDFAIYRHSTGRYGELPMACTRGEVADVVSMAMNAYNLG